MRRTYKIVLSVTCATRVPSCWWTMTSAALQSLGRWSLLRTSLGFHALPPWQSSRVDQYAKADRQLNVAGLSLADAVGESAEPAACDGCNILRAHRARFIRDCYCTEGYSGWRCPLSCCGCGGGAGAIRLSTSLARTVWLLYRAADSGRCLVPYRIRR